MTTPITKGPVSPAVSTAKKKKSATAVPVTVHIKPGQQVVVTNTPKSTDIQRKYFYKWLEQNAKVPEGTWARVTKHHPKCRRSRFCVCPPNHIQIADMHTMALVNAIRWCIRLADDTLRSSSFELFAESRATLLARSSKWAELLAEGKKRQLRIVGDGTAYNYNARTDTVHQGYNLWFEEAWLAVVMKKSGLE